MQRIVFYLRKHYKIWNRKRLKNKDFTIISSNCIGGCILHDLSMRFNSPFVNLWVKPADYLKMLQNFKGYMDCPMSFVKEEGIEYPIGLLDDIRIYFQHYSSEEQALTKWNERKQRINYDHLYVIFTDRDGCSVEQLKEFDNLNYEHKIVFTHIPYPNIKSAVYIKGFEHNNEVGLLTQYPNDKSIRKIYDQFDYVSWLNM